MENTSKPSRTASPFGLSSRLRRLILLIAFLLFAGQSAPAAVVALTGEKGNTEISVQPEDTFEAILSIAEAENLVGFQIQLGLQGPLTLVEAPTAGPFLTQDHEFFTFGDVSLPFVVLLSDATDESGIGELAVFTLRADANGIATVSIPEDGLILVNRDGKVAEWESAGDITITISDGKAQESGTSSATGGEALTSGEGGSGGGMLLTVDCCDSLPPYPCTGFMKRDSRRTTSNRVINILDLIVVQNAQGQSLDEDGHFATRTGTASDLDSDGDVDSADLTACYGIFNQQCATLGAM
ncbi:MAG TPA: cohesin domain-containing protein, partial [Planctomycetota bacterium]|nr:cohesin domain-containing protein [Planctomycetota bacterium]